MTEPAASLRPSYEAVLQPALDGAMVHLLDLARLQTAAAVRCDIDEVERLSDRMRAALEHRASLLRSFILSVRKPN